MFPAGLSGWGWGWGVRLAPAPPGSWLPCVALLAWWPPQPRCLPARLRVRNFAVAFSLPACVSRWGCFHFCSRKQHIPSASATGGAQGPWGAAAASAASGGAAALPAPALIAATQGAGCSLGRCRVTETALVGRGMGKGVWGRHGCCDLAVPTPARSTMARERPSVGPRARALPVGDASGGV